MSVGFLFKKEKMVKLAFNAKREGSIAHKRVLCLFVTCLFSLCYFSAFVELAYIQHRILIENGEVNIFDIFPVADADEEADGSVNAPSTSFSEAARWSICQIQKNLMNSRALSPDADCNKIKPVDIIAFIFSNTSVEVASANDLYLLAPKNSPPVS